MNATIELAGTEPYWLENARYQNLLHAFLALHNQHSHDPDKITFQREDGFSLHFNLATNHASFGKSEKPEDERSWTVNIDDSQLFRLLQLFIGGAYDELRRFQWTGGPDAHDS